MDQTNRVLIVSVALLWIFIVFLIILLAWGAPDESIDRLGDLAGYLDDHNGTAAKLIHLRRSHSGAAGRHRPHLRGRAA